MTPEQEQKLIDQVDLICSLIMITTAIAMGAIVGMGLSELIG